jgi:hypothetical protein
MSTESTPNMIDTRTLYSRVLSRLMRQTEPSHACGGTWSVTELNDATAVRYIRNSTPDLHYVVSTRWARAQGTSVTVYHFGPDQAGILNMELEQQYQSVPHFLRAVLDAADKLAAIFNEV